MSHIKITKRWHAEGIADLDDGLPAAVLISKGVLLLSSLYVLYK